MNHVGNDWAVGFSYDAEIGHPKYAINQPLYESFQELLSLVNFDAFISFFRAGVETVKYLAFPKAKTNVCRRDFQPAWRGHGRAERPSGQAAAVDAGGIRFAEIIIPEVAPVVAMSRSLEDTGQLVDPPPGDVSGVASDRN
jgi:hypothetical protein